MAERIFIFRAGSTELVLPVTPDSYQVDKGINVELVNIHTLGDAVMTGYGTLATVKINCLLPARSYSFAHDNDPQWYIRKFNTWVAGRKKLRFIIGDTRVNMKVVVENFSYGETDGTNDVYATITLREYRQLQTVQLEATPAVENLSRESEEVSGKQETTHSIIYGDTLSAICQRYYGDASAATYNRLAAYNNIPNPHLIYAGNSLQIPQPLP